MHLKKPSADCCKLLLNNVKYNYIDGVIHWVTYAWPNWLVPNKRILLLNLMRKVYFVAE